MRRMVARLADEWTRLSGEQRAALMLAAPEAYFAAARVAARYEAERRLN